MIRTARWRATLGACVLLFGAAGARADATSDAAALHQFEEGRAAFDKGQYPQALASFTASIQALPSPNTRLYIARCYQALGKTASAYTNLKRASLEASDRLNATGEKRYAATRDAALAEAVELEAKVPHLTVAMPSDAPDGTLVKLDDTELPRATWGTAMDVDPGPHTLTATARRRVPFTKTLTIADAQVQRVEVSLARIPTALLTLKLKIRPAGLAVEVDGKPLDPTHIEATEELDVGEHKVVVRAPGYKDFAWHGALADGQSAAVDVQLVSGVSAGGSHGTPKWLFFGVAAVSVAALGVGAYFAVDATDRSSTEKAKDPLNRLTTEQDKIRSESTTANVLFVGGAAIAAAAGVLAFTTDWKGATSPPKTGTRVAPWFDGSTAGAVATGRF